ncbi:hypothetical protein PM082_021479 [Marasmius tenuissimus]|nr:hypothetical protein PM082_021479 [Marasmius tenuissimus]
MAARHHGSGPPNNDIARDQNNNYGCGQVEVINAGRDFVKTVNTTVSKRHKKLWDAVGGVGASHDAEQQYERGECLEGTRVVILRNIHEWRTAKKRSLPICWLSGTAGVGKSAIAMTVAKACEKDGLVTSFFFFRPDPKRNNPSALVPAIAHGLVVKMPFARTSINKRISDDPKILEARMEEQFRELVVKPCLEGRWWRRLLEKVAPTFKKPDLVIIDGLDECGNEQTQQRILAMILSSYQKSPCSPLRFLICSRPEAWIQEAFNRDNLGRITEQLVLDDSFMPDRDIERYYLHEFQAICTDPQYTRVQFPTPWPSTEDLACLVRKSSSQFVYAATAVRLIKLTHSNPTTQLRLILDYTPMNGVSESLFPRLDDLYHIILSLNPNHEKLLAILAAILILPPHAPPSPNFIELLLQLPPGEVDVMLRSMHSVLEIRDGNTPIHVYHTSFTDFLYDLSRSAQFFLDLPKYQDLLAQQWIQALGSNKLPALINDTEQLQTFWCGGVDFCCEIGKPSSGLISTLQNLDLKTIATGTVNRALLHNQGYSVAVRPFEMAISWLTSRESPVPTTLICHFSEALQWFGYRSREGPAQHYQSKLSGDKHDWLYHALLSTHPNPKQACLILAAILILPRYLKPTLAHLVLVLGLPMRLVTLTVQAMYSVLAFQDDTADALVHIHDSSFTDYLVTKRRSLEFYIDIEDKKHVITRLWLQNLSTRKSQTYSLYQLYSDTTVHFFTKWMKLCMSFLGPTEDLLDDLQNIDLACAYTSLTRNRILRWAYAFDDLAEWLKKSRNIHDPKHPITRLQLRLERHPSCFHLEWQPDVSPHDHIVHWVVRRSTACMWGNEFELPKGNTHQLPRLTECHCDLQHGGTESHNPQHLAYQDACLQVATAYVSHFKTLPKNSREKDESEDILMNLLYSSLLKHCRLGVELFSLCQTFFELAKGYTELKTFYQTTVKRARASVLLEWIEAFPDHFAGEAEALKSQILALPWEKWLASAKE